MFGKVDRFTAMATLLALLLIAPPLGAQPAASEKKPATVVIKLPEKARLIIEGHETRQTGPQRQFETPPLTPGQKFAYNLEAIWTEDGKEVVRKRQVVVEAGARVEVEVAASEKPVPLPTLIGSFRLEPVADVTIEPGGVALFSVRIRRDKLTAPVSVTCTDVPASVDVQRGIIAEGKNVIQLEARASDSAAAGSYRIKVEASAGDLREQTTFSLTVEKTKTAVRLAVPDSVIVAPGGKTPVQVTVEGARMDRSFQVNFGDLPRGVKITGLTIQVQATVEASGDAEQGKKNIKVQAQSGAARTDATLAVDVRKPLEVPITPSKEPVHKPETPHNDIPKPPEVVKKPDPPAPEGASLKLALPEVLELKPGESRLLPVRVQREGVTGPVTFAYPVLPEGIVIEGTLHSTRQKGYLRATAAGAEPGEKTLKGIATCGSVHAAFTLKVKVAP